MRREGGAWACLPSIGDVPGLLFDPIGTLTRCRREQGDVAALSVPTRSVFLVSHPREIRQVLAERAAIYRRDPWHAAQLREVSGRGLTASEGSLWSAQRRSLRRELVAERVDAMYLTAVETTDAMLARWRVAATAGEAVDLGVELPRVSLEILTRCLFSVDVHAEATAILSDAATVLDHMYERMRLGWPLLARTIKPHTHKFLAARAALYGRAHIWLAERSARRGQLAGSEDLAPAGLLDRLSAEEDRQLAADQVVTMILAGHDTTGAALAWACHLLATDAGVAAPPASSSGAM